MILFCALLHLVLSLSPIDEGGLASAVKKGPVLVLFLAKPDEENESKRAIELLEGFNAHDLKVYWTDCNNSDNRRFCYQNEILSYPTLVMYHSPGVRLFYDGELGLESIRQWCERAFQPVSKELADGEIMMEDISFVLMNYKKQGTVDTWERAIAKYRGKFGFYHTPKNELDGTTLKGAKLVVSVRDQDDVVYPFHKGRLDSIIAETEGKTVLELTASNFERIMRRQDKFLVLAFIDTRDPQMIAATIDRMKGFAARCSKDAYFGYADSEQFKEFKESMRIDESATGVIMNYIQFLYFNISVGQDACGLLEDILGNKATPISLDL